MIIFSIKDEPLGPPVIKICEWGPWDQNGSEKNFPGRLHRIRQQLIDTAGVRDVSNRNMKSLVQNGLIK